MMTRNDEQTRLYEGFKSPDERELAGQVHDALDQVSLSEEAQERILGELRAAQQARTGAAGPTKGLAVPEAPEAHSASAAATKPRRRTRAATKPHRSSRRFLRPRTLLPLAAALALCVVGVRIWSMQSARETTILANVPEASEVSTTAPSTEGVVDSEAYDTSMKSLSSNGMATEGLTADGMAYEDGLGIEEGIPFNTEEYDSLEEPGFVSPRTKPLSTLSSDVDTASYCNLRRMLRDGYRVASADETQEDEYDDYGYYSDTIPTGAVRIEEMLNYFSYDYAQGEGEDLFGCTVHVGDCPWNEQTKLVTLGFATSPEATSVAEKGRNLVFLIDVSGSMDSADKLGLLKEAFDVLVDQLDENDRVSIVTYASGEDVVLEGARGNEHRRIMRAIRSLRADGMTNGEAGLQMAYEIAQDNYIEGGVNRIVMASDGDLNVGISSESDLHDYVDKQRASGIYLSVLGFGTGNYKDNKMETLADHGNGSYHYIDCVDEAERVFGDKLSANLVPLADDVKVQVEFNPATVKGYRLIGYENRAMADEDFRDDTKDAGDVGPGAQFTVAYEVALVGSEQEVVESELKYGEGAMGDAASNEWLTATIRYRGIESDEAREQQVVVSEGSLSDNPGDDWQFQAALIEFGMLLRNSSYAGTASFEGLASQLDAMELSDERAELRELVDLALPVDVVWEDEVSTAK